MFILAEAALHYTYIHTPYITSPSLFGKSLPQSELGLASLVDIHMYVESLDPVQPLNSKTTITQFLALKKLTKGGLDG